ncbi:MAG: SprB repeat-containing protein, partial [Bacteroidota bacterium]
MGVSSCSTSFDAEDAFISTTCPDGCYNDPNGGLFASDVNTALCAIPGFGALCYDTWWTIGVESAADGGFIGIANTIVLDDQGNDIGTEYTDICNQVIDDGAIFTTPDQTQGIAGSDLEVLIAQITVCEGFCMSFGIQTFIEGDQGNPEFVQEEFCYTDPCVEFPMDTVLTISDDIDCNGELATIGTNGGGNGVVEYILWETDADGNLINELSTQNNPEFTGLMEGSYLLTMIDEFGCCDTTSIVSMVEPPLLEAVMTASGTNSCFDAIDQSICVDVTGGTGAYTIELLDCADDPIASIQNNECFEDITCVDNCGDFSVLVRDENDCPVTEDFTINCPAEITADLTTGIILCEDQCTGSITGTIDGGTGDLTIVFAPALPVPAPSAGPIQLNVTDICSGTYTMTITDENDCTFTEIFEFDNPAGMTVTYNVTPALCFGDCNGQIAPIVQGGTPDYTFVVVSTDGVPADATALCAGEYIHTTLDANDCPVIDTLTIDEPDEIIFETAVTDILCAGEANGVICVENLTGGVGTINYELVPAIGALNGSCFEALTAGNFSITVSDDNCSITENGLEVVEPDPIVITLTKTDISCFGANDGQIIVEATGGTGTIMVIPEMTAVPFTYTDLAPGAFPVTVQDANNCLANAAENIEEPELLTAEVLSTSNIGCGGECDGEADILIQGGTGDYSITYNEEELNLMALCADEYVDVQISDENDCITLVTFDIVQPDPIEILNTITPVTCTGMNDGELDIFPIGGTGPIVWTVEPDNVTTNLFEGEYFVTAVDSIGCTADSLLIVTAAIETDMEIEMFSSPVTCWNTGDGTATAAVTGGELPITWQWNDPMNQSSPTAVGLDEEVYTVIVTDAIGCTLSGVVEVEPTEG